MSNNDYWHALPDCKEKDTGHAQCDHGHGKCFIIPPHIVDNIVRNGTAAQRDTALHSLRVSSQIRGVRSVRGMLAVELPTGRKRRTIYDTKTTENLPGVLVRGEGSAAGKDVSVNEAYSGSGSVFDFYKEVFGRISVDGKGMRLDSTVHYGKKYDNAFWNGQQMVYGDGDGKIFGRFTVSLDVIGHELTHGVTQFEAGLEYQDQPGALNESMSDVFGILVKQWSLGQTAKQANWIIGEGLLGPKINGVGLRSMKAPGTAYNDPLLGQDPQPAHMKNYYNGPEDNQGVHINSGIPNLAFYLTASAIGGYAWKKAGKIWYSALTEWLKPQSSFHDARVATMGAADEFYGKTSAEYRAVVSAWNKVGVV